MIVYRSFKLYSNLEKNKHLKLESDRLFKIKNMHQKLQFDEMSNLKGPIEQP